MAEEDDAPPTPEITEVEITVAGHTIIVKSAAALDEVAAKALGLYEQTKIDGKRIPVGFDNTAAQVERADPPSYTGLSEGEDEDARMGRQPPQGEPAL